jgi:hypothetical protein
VISPEIVIRSLSLACVLFVAVGCSVAADRAAAPVDSRVSVTFVQPEQFTDARDGFLGSPRGTAALLAEIDDYLRTAGQRYVPAGLTLSLRITNIDLAGDFEPWRGPNFDRVRIMRDIYPPRVVLEFRLTDATGTVVKEGDRVLLDQFYLTSAAFSKGERLYYDKLLLGDWLRREFAPPQASRPGA